MSSAWAQGQVEKPQLLMAVSAFPPVVERLQRKRTRQGIGNECSPSIPEDVAGELVEQDDGRQQPVRVVPPFIGIACQHRLASRSETLLDDPVQRLVLREALVRRHLTEPEAEHGRGILDDDCHGHGLQRGWDHRQAASA